jgi:hypothetical protein
MIAIMTPSFLSGEVTGSSCNSNIQHSGRSRAWGEPELLQDRGVRVEKLAYDIRPA